MEWADDPDREEAEHFCSFIRGGKWTLAHHGVNYDTYICRARAGLLSEWARIYSLGVVCSFPIRKFGEKACDMLAAEVARRCEFYYGLYVASAAKVHEYSMAELSSYAETLEFVTLLLEEVTPAQAHIWDRAQGVRGFCLATHLRELSSWKKKKRV